MKQILILTLCLYISDLALQTVDGSERKFRIFDEPVGLHWGATISEIEQVLGERNGEFTVGNRLLLIFGYGIGLYFENEMLVALAWHERGFMFEKVKPGEEEKAYRKTRILQAKRAKMDNNPFENMHITKVADLFEVPVPRERYQHFLDVTRKGLLIRFRLNYPAKEVTGFYAERQKL